MVELVDMFLLLCFNLLPYLYRLILPQQNYREGYTVYESTGDTTGTYEKLLYTPSNDPAETFPRRGSMMTRQENWFPRQI